MEFKRSPGYCSLCNIWYFSLGEYTSKVAFHWSGGTLPWGHAEEAWDPVLLYRKLLSEAEDGSVTIASIGFLDSLSGLLNSTADSYSILNGRDLVARKVAELVIMGGGYPSGYSWNFWGSNSSLAAHVVNTWEGRMVFVGDDVGKDVKSGGELMSAGPKTDPVRMAYIYYSYYVPASSWDPLAILYAIGGLGALFEYGNEYGYNHVEGNGENQWVWNQHVKNQFFLRLKVSNETAAEELDRLFLQGALSVGNQHVVEASQRKHGGLTRDEL
ncbi:hypothetical protein V492_06026 [Pseudogymnoascus sp. VKM F-4246]|nr:hypothetical protein V492_06026 [Pseudogymnoascus sp. VKM F-4246]